MKRAAFIWRISQAASASGVVFVPERRGVRHEVWRCGRLRVVIPRRREIDEQAALRIRAYVEPALREGWRTQAARSDLGSARSDPGAGRAHVARADFAWADLARVDFARPTYRAIAERSGDWWALHVLELPGVFTQARRLDLAEGAVSDAIAAFLGTLPRAFDVEILPSLPPEIEARLEEVRALRQEVERMERAAVDATDRLAQVLLERGLTVRDAGRLLGLSYQRVAQVAVSRRATRGQTRRVAP